ncbi:hypothetical protein J1N35_023229 [Gossypium stocksii]|uniref:Uncharacterized protein n=1 Tax=Gossypium stocksii TaxID=47602 RepID=A0A9D4A2Z5_9ROSI|nr:hypothetical protein J1N35_023229 [Gossypium stocksii]
MSKGIDKQIELMETSGRDKKASISRDMALALEGQVTNLEESKSNVKKTLKAVDGYTNKLDLVKEQLKEFVVDTLGSNMETIQGIINSNMDKLTVRDNAFEAMVTALKEQVAKLKRELANL